VDLAKPQGVFAPTRWQTPPMISDRPHTNTANGGCSSWTRLAALQVVQALAGYACSQSTVEVSRIWYHRATRSHVQEANVHRTRQHPLVCRAAKEHMTSWHLSTCTYLALTLMMKVKRALLE
jgi:hypothetical protein